MWMAYQNNIELTKLEYESLENARINYEIAIDRYKLGIFPAWNFAKHRIAC